jgi:hypothetical protein
MTDKTTRRQFASIAACAAAASLSAVTAIAQVPPPSQDLDAAARESHRQNSAALAKFEITISLEPAFQFKA